MQNRIHDFLMQAAVDKPDDLAVIDHQNRSVTWAELLTMMQDASVQLQSRDVRPGDRVVLVFENSLSVLAFLWAASLLNVIVVPINSRLSKVELDRIIAHSDPAAVVFCTGDSSAAASHAKVFVAEPVQGAFGAVAIFVRADSVAEPVFDSGAEQVAILMYTSGTTGAPKAAMLTHHNLIAAAYATAKVRDIKPSDVCFLALPLSHIYGLVTILALSLVQATVRLESSFSVERLFDALQDDVTFFPGVPQMHAHLFHYARSKNKPKYNRGLLRFVSSGGAPMDPLWKREAEAFYGLALQNGYGLTEGTAGVCATVNCLGDSDISVGYPMQDCLLKLDMDAVGSTADQGIGEILVGGPQVMKGYFRDSEQTAAAFDENGYFRTGDLGSFDGKGRLHIAGRSKELIIRSGFNIYPTEVEATLNNHPEVIVAGVVGRALEGNEEVLGFVKVSEGCGLTEQDFKDFVHDKLAPYKRPSRIIVTTNLPTAPTGKILKAKLIQMFATELAQG